MNKNINKTYETADFYLTAFLLSKGLQLISTRQVGPKKILFILEDTPERKELVSAFYSGQAMVNPLVYQNQLKNLKSLIYNTI